MLNQKKKSLRKQRFHVTEPQHTEKRMKKCCDSAEVLLQNDDCLSQYNLLSQP